MNTEQFKNQIAPTAVLVAAISAIDTTCIVSNPANFPVLAATGQQFQMPIQDTPNSAVEIVTVTATDGANFTITRGTNGTAALSHIAGAAVANAVTAAQFAAMYPNFLQNIGNSPMNFDGSVATLEVKPATPQAVAVSIKTANLVPGRMYVIADGTANAAANNITITPDSGNIGGAANYVISVNNGALRFYWNGTNCRIV